MPSSVDALRRWFGLLFLAVAGGMLIWGQTILRPHLEGVGFLIYWFICFLITISAIVVALLDMRAVRRRTREEQRALLEQALKSKSHDESPKASSLPRKPGME